MDALERAIDMTAKHIIVRMVQETTSYEWSDYAADIDKDDWDLIRARMDQLVEGWDPAPNMYRRGYAYLQGRSREVS